MRFPSLNRFVAATIPLGGLLLAGCAKTPEHSGAAASHSSLAAPRRTDADARPSYVFSTGTVYYHGDPERGHKPDGTFRRGTRVTILRRAGNYSVVQAEDGSQAYVATHTLEPLAMQ